MKETIDYVTEIVIDGNKVKIRDVSGLIEDVFDKDKTYMTLVEPPSQVTLTDGRVYLYFVKNVTCKVNKNLLDDRALIVCGRD